MNKLVTIAALSGLAAVSGARAGIVAGNFGEPRILVEPPADRATCHLAWPKMTKTKDGAIVLSCVAGASHVNGKGRVAAAFSTDGGKTFSPLSMPEWEGPKPGEDMGNNAMGTSADGTVAMLGMAYTGVTANGVIGWFSTDAGATWTQSDTSAISFNKTGSVFGHVIEIPGRGFAVFGHTRPPDRPKGGIWMALSSDSGRSWGDPVDICGRRELYEPDVAIAGGKMILLTRDDKIAGYWQFTSADNGATWSEPTLVMGDNGPVHGHPSPCIMVDPSNPNRLVALQTRRYNWNDRANSHGEINLWTADAATLEWRKVGCIAKIEGIEDYGYPSMVHIEGNRWMAVFYAGKFVGPNAIWAVDFTVE